MDRLSPETTEVREGFLHPYQVEGGVARASVRILLRDFETSALRDYATLLDQIAAPLRAKYPRAAIEIEIVEQYRNMRDGLAKEPRALAKALEATRAAGLDVGERLVITADGPGRVVLEREADVLDEFVGALTGLFTPGELDRLRDEWE